ncbi:MAG: N-acetylmuramoyl-L-alanine amidase-like domain-containing protein [Myxococcota bacterium]
MIALLWGAAAHADPASFDAADGAAPTTAGATSPGVGGIPPEVAQIARDVRGKPLPERIGAISAALLGRPYVADPMGEGVLPDADPFARYDAFDCLTFAEEVLALSLAGDPADAGAVRSSLRYGDHPRDYVHRRHFMELQWIPGTIADGWLRDTTTEYGATVVLDKQVTAATWSAWSGRAKFAHTDAELPVGAMHLAVLPLDEALRVADTIRPGSIILTVRVDRPGVPLWTTHVSLLVPGPPGQPAVLRHATKIGNGGTRDHGFTWYLEHLKTYTNWKVLGLTVLEPIDPAPRASAAP